MIWVRSRYWTENEWTPQIATAVISITTPSDEDASLPNSEHIKAILRIQFHDTGPGENSELQPMTMDHAKSLVHFLMNLPEPVGLVLVHCDAGISRSAGVAAAISKVLYGDDSFFFINYLPNRWCHKLVLEAFQIASDGMN